ncbi:gamma DNA-directed DNA polymerase [Rhodotorula toruloides]|uniref:Mitochondrial DNA polymerase catalytic subunit n=1 Tax=Rhodotorula toruloides TaxID=5286 RepID=A0A511KAJ8_RHOTO|nr:gamma DNA-directed DNA polymerase [Rhodotorula toruloides]
MSLICRALRPAKRRRLPSLLPAAISPKLSPSSQRATVDFVGMESWLVEDTAPSWRLGGARKLHTSYVWRAATATSEPSLTPLNEVQVPLISRNLRAQLFPPAGSPFAPAPPSADAIRISTQHLRQHELLPDPAKAPAKKPPVAVEFDLPRLQGPTLSHHFHALGQDIAEPYLSMAKRFAKAKTPPMPVQQHWTRTPGWTVYHPDGSCESIDYPPEEERTLVFDVETMPYAGGHFPIMAVAVGEKGWYGWCSPWLSGDDDKPNHLIPFGRKPSATRSSASATDDFASRSQLFERSDSPPRLLIGHNVLFDRARIANEYDLRRPSTRYLDTLSLHVAVSGLTNPQRPLWLKHRKEKAEAEKKKDAGEVSEADAGNDMSDTQPLDEDDVLRRQATKLPSESILSRVKSSTKRKFRSGSGMEIDPDLDWRDVSSTNSLAEVARLHCGVEADKTLREVLIDPSLEIKDARDFFNELIDYCARDVDVTLRVYRVLLPKFLDSCPHPVTFAGVTLMSQPVLPVDEKWPAYIERAEGEYQRRLEGVNQNLKIIAEETRAKFYEKDASGRFVWENDPWLSQLDWNPKKAKRLPKAVIAQVKAAQQAAEEVARLAEAEAEQVVEEEAEQQVDVEEVSDELQQRPVWADALEDLDLHSNLVPLLLEVTWRRYPVVSSSKGWLFAVPKEESFEADTGETPVDLSIAEADRLAGLGPVRFFRVASPRGAASTKRLASANFAKAVAAGTLASPFRQFEELIGLRTYEFETTHADRIRAKVLEQAERAMALSEDERNSNAWLQQLDWTTEAKPARRSSHPKTKPAAKRQDAVVAAAITTNVGADPSDLIWPQWYWDLDSRTKGLDITIGKRATPLLLRLCWLGYPLAYSKNHGWMYRVPQKDYDKLLAANAQLKPVKFDEPEDASFAEDRGNFYFKLPHPDGEEKNVGNPLSKPFVKAFENGILTSEYPIAKAALDLNASCSYWKSARERITGQMVVWDGDARREAPSPQAIAAAAAKADSQGLILPQVIPMGTITRRAVERTWLTASNAKKNRVGSELKSMIRAPSGYAIVGADVDSEELWICSVMGDAQFGIHGATAIGWMGLEGTKSAGTDLHSKTASILGISRDDAKVFNYSRIYGAGVAHAVQLLLKSNPALSKEEATELAKNLYKATKGNTDRGPAFDRKFWHGGTESFVFNKLEEIAMMARPRTPALGCGLTAALTKEYLKADGMSKAGEGFLPSRVNWVVQSSGVDYLHLLIVSMEYLCKRFEIDARYLISVHDEVRYLVKEEDKYRAALAMQVANLWTRSLFAYRLQMGDLPQGCAFFSAVDVDSCFRKEVFMTCETPSNPEAIPPGESLEIEDTLEKTAGTLFADGRSMVEGEATLPSLELRHELPPSDVMGDQHRVLSTEFLEAQATTSPAMIRRLFQQYTENQRRARLGLPLTTSKASQPSRRAMPAPRYVEADDNWPPPVAGQRWDAFDFDDPELMPITSRSYGSSR